MKGLQPQEKETKFKENKIWLENDGIIRINIGKKMEEEIFRELTERLKEIAEKVSGKLTVLVDVSKVPHIPSSAFRKMGVNLIKDLFKNPGFKKIALWGGGKIQRTVASFVITTTRMKTIKHFNTKEEALKWLKEE